MTQPTTGYTTEEITTAVSSLVQATISVTNDTLGPARRDITFGDIQNAAAGVFLLYPKSPFYCLYLGAQRIQQQVTAEAAILDQLVAAIQAVGRQVLPISDVSPLANAVAALQALGAAATGRTSSFTDISKVPQYQQFNKNVQAFLAGNAGQAVKSNGQVVMTPQEARAAIPGLVSQLQAAHQTLVTSVTTLAGGEDDFNELNLAAVVAQSVISNAATLLQKDLAALQPLQPAERLASVRQVVLDIISSQAVVTQYGSNQGTTDIFDITGTGIPYSDAQNLANPASSTASIAAPYNVQSPNQYLDLYLDGVGLTPRGTTTLNAIVPVGDGAIANLEGTITSDVQAGDYFYVKSGLNAGTRWIVSQIFTGYVQAYSANPAQHDVSTITVEVLPPPSVEVVLPFASSAAILGIIPETAYSAGNGYLISNGTHPTRYPSSLNIPAANNELQLTIGGTNYTIPLTLSSDAVGTTDAIPRTAQQICDDINAVITPSNFQAVPYFAYAEFQGQVIQTAIAGSQASFALYGGFGNFVSQGISVGDTLVVQTGDPTQQGLWTINVVAAGTLTATMQSAGTAITQADPITIQVGSPLRYIKLVAINPTLAVNNQTSVTVLTTTTAATKGASTLGLSPGGTARSSPQTSKDIASFITANTTACSATTLFTPSASVSGRTNPTNGLLLTLTIVEETVTTTVTGPTLSVAITGLVEAGVAVGDILVERGGANPGTVWQLATVTDSGITATLLSGSSLSQVDIEIELGPNVSLPTYSMVRIPSGANAGDYYVQSQDYIDLTLTRTLPQPYDPDTTQAVTFSVMAGQEALVIQSSDTTTSSLVKVRGPAAPLFYLSSDPAVNAGVAGTTVYFQLPSIPQSLDIGDLLQFFNTTYASPSQSQSITAVNGTVLTLDGPVASNVQWAMSPTAQVPYANVATGHVADFTLFEDALLAWAAQPSQQALYFTNLNADINPIIASASPTTAQINTALQSVYALYNLLTEAQATSQNKPVADTLEYILDSYNVIDQSQIDQLVRSYTEKGADRAVDLLLAGSFQEFFGLSPQDTSYGGYMQSTAQAVVMNDLPVRKINRTNTQTSQLMGSTTDPDPEYNFDDSENATPDPLSPDQQADPTTSGV